MELASSLGRYCGLLHSNKETLVVRLDRLHEGWWRTSNAIGPGFHARVRLSGRTSGRLRSLLRSTRRYCRSTLCVLLFAVSPELAFANGEVTSTKVDHLGFVGYPCGTDAGCAFVYFTHDVSGGASCGAAQPKRFVLDLTTARGQRMFETVRMALSENLVIQATGEGNCNIWSNTESLRHLSVFPNRRNESTSDVFSPSDRSLCGPTTITELVGGPRHGSMMRISPSCSGQTYVCLDPEGEYLSAEESARAYALILAHFTAGKKIDLSIAQGNPVSACDGSYPVLEDVRSLQE